jgi:hypothetical protein
MDRGRKARPLILQQKVGTVARGREGDGPVPFVAPVFDACMPAATECSNPEDQNRIEKGASTNP